jgi:hypothetical protein
MTTNRTEIVRAFVRWLPLQLLLSSVFAGHPTQDAALGPESVVLKNRGIERAEIVLDAKGRPHVISDQGAGNVFYSYNDGGQWLSRSVFPDPPTTEIATEPYIVTASGEEAFVTFHWASKLNQREGRIAVLRIGSLAGTPKIGQPEILGGGRFPHLRVDSKGRLHVLWRIDRDLYYRVRSPAEEYSELRRLTNTRITLPDEEMGGCSPNFDFAVGADSIVHGTCTNVLGVFYTNSIMEAADQGVLLIAPGHKVGCEGPFTLPRMAVDTRDPHIVYVLFAGVDKRTYLIRRDPYAWREPVLAVSADSRQSGPRTPPAITALPDGGAVMAWMDDRSSQYEVYLRSIASDGHLGPEMRVASGRNPRLCVAFRRSLHVVYTREGNLLHKPIQLPDERP